MNRRDLMKWFGATMAAGVVPPVLARDLFLENLRNRTVILPAANRMFIPSAGSLVFYSATGRVLAEVRLSPSDIAVNGTAYCSGSGNVIAYGEAVSATLFGDEDGRSLELARLSVGAPDLRADISSEHSGIQVGDTITFPAMGLSIGRSS